MTTHSHQDKATELAKALDSGPDDKFLNKFVDLLLTTDYEYTVAVKFESREKALAWVKAAYERAGK